MDRQQKGQWPHQMWSDGLEVSPLAQAFPHLFLGAPHQLRRRLCHRRQSLEARIDAITARRNQIATKMIAMLEDAAFAGQSIDKTEARRLIDEASDLLDSVP